MAHSMYHTKRVQPPPSQPHEPTCARPTMAPGHHRCLGAAAGARETAFFCM